MIINNPEIKKITQDIDKIVKEAIKEQERVNTLIEKFKKDDADRLKAVDVLKAKRWKLIQTLDLGLKEFEVITEMKIENGKLNAIVENLQESWIKEFRKQQKEQDKRAEEALNPKKETTTKK